MKIKDVTIVVQNEEYGNGLPCPDCGGRCIFESGCWTCHNCGWSLC